MRKATLGEKFLCSKNSESRRNIFFFRSVMRLTYARVSVAKKEERTMVALLSGNGLLLIEPIPLITVHSDNVGLVQVIGDKMHFGLYTNQPSATEHGLIEHVLNHRQALPIAAVWAVLPLVIARAAEAAALNATDITKRLIMNSSAFH